MKEKHANARRRWLMRAAAGGAGMATAMAALRRSLAAENAGRGIARIQGDARINGEPARAGMPLRAGDVIVTAPGGELVAVAGRDAYLVRGESRVELAAAGSRGAPELLRVLSGALLAVFAEGERKEIRTASASIGIRGTAVYVEVEPERTYVCTCYGTARLAPVYDLQSAETVRTRHHDQPRYIYPQGMPRMIETAPVVNHTDAELTMLEALVGRKPPFKRPRY